ncbi:MAG: hypothetical protein SFW07_01755 [Gammaproteobacteria bacterium]|nr:hypothetical protein [Gammaproteobacteria bacterium]
MEEEGSENNIPLVNADYDENPVRNGICSWMYTCASYVAIPFVATANYFQENPEVVSKALVKYTTGFEFVASGFNGWGTGQTIQAVVDQFLDTGSQTKFLGVSLYILIPCVSLSYLAGWGAAATHNCTNMNYALSGHNSHACCSGSTSHTCTSENHTKMPDNASNNLSFRKKLYIKAILLGDYYDHVTNDPPTMIAEIQLIWPSAPPLFNAIAYPALYLLSGISTYSEWIPCKKNVIKYYYGEEEEEKAETVASGFLTKFNAVWSGLNAVASAHSGGLLVVSVTGGTPVFMGLTVGGIVFSAVIGTGSAAASTFTHFLVQTGYDKHSGFSHSSDTLNRKGLILVYATNAFDFIFHLLDYASSPIQITDQALRKNGAASHVRAFAIAGITAASAIACISEVGICQEESKQGIAKLCAKYGKFQDRSFLPTRTSTSTYEEIVDDPNSQLVKLI